MDRTPGEVFDQSGELNGYNLFSTHSALMDAYAGVEPEALCALGSP